MHGGAGIDAVHVGELGAVGLCLTLLGWLVRRTFTHTIPRLASTYENSLLSLREAFERVTDKQWSAFREEMATFRAEAGAERKGFRDEMRAERDVTRELTEAINRNTQALVSGAGDEGGNRGHRD